jgi:hypothetical protein
MQRFWSGRVGRISMSWESVASHDGATPLLPREVIQGFRSSLKADRRLRVGKRCSRLYTLPMMTLVCRRTEFRDRAGITLLRQASGCPFFVQIAHGAEAEAKKINPSVKFTAQSSGYDVNTQTNQMDNFVASGVKVSVRKFGVKSSRRQYSQSLP